jgi:isoleucyl-tRNA synthetase
VDASGRFTSEVPPFAGVHVKEADAAIIKHLKANEQLVWHGRCVHSYPFCWRSDTPLIYKAVPSFFVRVEKHRDELLANMEQTVSIAYCYALHIRAAMGADGHP